MDQSHQFYQNKVMIFNAILNMQIHEFGDHFNEIITKNLENMVPCVCGFILQLKCIKINSEMYPNNFTANDISSHLFQVEVCYHIMSNGDRFANLNDTVNLAHLKEQVF